jgi:hypothetical protein
MFDKLLILLENINLEELKEFTVQKETLIDDINKILQWLAYEKKKRNIELVHRIGKRKTKIQKWTEQLSEYKKRQEKCRFQKLLWKSVKYPIKILQLNLELN